MADLNEERAHPTFKHWYQPNDDGHSCLDPATEAYEDAKKIFANNLTKDKQKLSFLSEKTSMQDVNRVVNEAKEAYDRERQGAKAYRWLSAFSSRLMYYGGVLDTLAQHHPEYVALAWGTVKLIFIGILNQEELVSTFAKAMSRIADCLPRQQLSLILYPTTQMKQGVAQLYAFLLQFLIKALKWYQEGTVKHIIHSFTQPVGIKYKDILENIEECSRNIDMWAASSSQAELRDVHTLQQKMQTSVEKTRSVVQRSAVSVDEIMKVVIAMAPQLTTVVTGQLNTNQRVFDLQLSQMFTVTGKTGLLDPESSYRFGILRRNRLRQYPTRQSAFPQSPKLKNWAISQRSSLVIVRSTYSMRDQAKNFAVDVIEAVQSALIPISWILPNLVQDPSKPLSSTDILKSLVHQTMRLNQNFQQESTCALNCARMQSAVNETEWFDILGATLVGLPLIYIVFDASILNKTDGPLSEDFSWPVAFLKLFQELASRGSGTVVKLVIIQYNESRQMRVESLDQAQDSIVNVDRPARKTAKRQRVTLKNQLPFRRNEISTRQKREGDGYHNT